MEPSILRRIATLPPEWPLSGSLRPAVLAALERHARAVGPLDASVETGTGKSTLLLSHLSRHHLVFTRDDAGDGDSLDTVRASELLRRDTTEFIVGPTQATLPTTPITRPLQLVFLDGPHGFPFPHLEYYFLHPHLTVGGLLGLDDIHIRAVNDLFRFLCSDRMFRLIEVIHTTAFFGRTTAPLFDPLGDGWWLQPYNVRVWPPLRGLSAFAKAKAMVPLWLKERLRSVRRGYVPVLKRGPRA